MATPLLYDTEQAARFFALLAAQDPNPRCHAWQVRWKWRAKYTTGESDNITRDVKTFNAAKLASVAAERLQLLWRPDADARGECVYAQVFPCNMPVAVAQTQLALAQDPNAHWYPTLRANVSRAHVKLLKHLDVDTKDAHRLRQVSDMLVATKLKECVLAIIETHSGVHIVYKCREKFDHKGLHDFCMSTQFSKPNIKGDMVTDTWCAVSNGGLVALPGSLQNGFRVRLVSDLIDLN